MKRKLSSLILALLLVVTLISCDAAVSVMGAMGNNILGVDKSTLNSAVESVKVTEKPEVTELSGDDLNVNGSTTLNEGKTISYKNSEGKDVELFKVGKTTSDAQVVIIAGTPITVSNDVDVVSIVSILPPQDLTAVADALGSSGKAKEAMLAELNKTISDEDTKESAKGTATILRAILGLVNTSSKSSSSASASITRGEGEEVSTDDALSLVNIVKKNLDEALKDPDKLTMGDVVVLQAFTNVLTTLEEEAGELVSALTGGSSNWSSLLDTILKKSETLINQTINILSSATGTSSIFKNAGVSELISKITNTGK